ncbi:sensor histidine kinase [Dactylosporangium sp. CS-047395]|uniref:sensor histidine kinase n=1 Tax=Dactylosporangium sp. CS-047395 TaxID=3239936 RepID=UPI003D90E634
MSAVAGSRTAWAVACLGVTALGVAVAVTALVAVPVPSPEFRDSMIDCVAYLIPYGLAGAFLIHRRPDLPFGWLLGGSAVLLAVAGAAEGAGGWALLHERGGDWPMLLVATGGFEFVAVAVQGLINVRFPGGRIESRTGRVLNALMVGGLVLMVVGGFLGSETAGTISAQAGRTVRNPLTGDGPLAHLADFAQIGGPLVVLIGLLAGLHIVVRARRARGVQRQQLLWRAIGVVQALLLFPLVVLDLVPSAAFIADGTVFVATLVVPILVYRLWDIDTVIRRSIGYAAVTVLLAVAYLAVAALGAAVASQWAGIVAGGFVVALAYGPARTATQRWLDRRFYGLRSDPYRTMSDLNRRLAAVAEPGTVLPAAVSGVARSLRLPYVAIERDGQFVAAHGTPTGGSPQRWPLTYRGAPVGALLAHPRSGETEFGHRDRAVLGDLAAQLGAAVHAEALTADLIESRQRLVTAREDERRRLRRELHDSLGPMLTGFGLNVDAARARLATVPSAAAADATLVRAREVATRAIDELRGIVYDLRPPALDDLGLVGAVRANAARLAEGSGLTVVVTPDDAGDLPAAVEVAAFRIAVEAISNVVRHARASTCTVTFERAGGPSLTVAVTDDDPGAAGWTPGVGLLSMRERAGELGGSFTAGPSPSGGRVHARLPLAAAS